ncbi:unnamed protein product [Effrenium voratum]|uniref:Uncharacterized protein n=2 Tax=Effrenium voratum TaxID=2562239 RepID=A0AA36JJ18_9DINO|nr:unnamed protein product [Effrenium voratum]CAJ1442887.1 unnamed protein product [Effrenium voratum]
MAAFSGRCDGRIFATVLASPAKTGARRSLRPSGWSSSLALAFCAAPAALGRRSFVGAGLGAGLGARAAASRTVGRRGRAAGRRLALRAELLREGLGNLSLEQQLPSDEDSVLELIAREGVDAVAPTLEQLLADGALRAALAVYQRWCVEQRRGRTANGQGAAWNRALGGRTPVSLFLRGQVLQILGEFSQFDFAVQHVKDLLDEGALDLESASEMFNRILSGLVQSKHPLSSERADLIFKEIFALDLVNDEALRLLVEAKTHMASPNFLIEVSQTLAEAWRCLRGPPGGQCLLAVSSAMLRGGNLEAAYLWFLASQNVRPRLELVAPQDLELVSQLARGLAISGRARELLRLLRRVQQDGGRLPKSTGAMALAGYACGRTLGTVWLEPPASFLRRRATYASSRAEGVAVACAEQWEWKRLETSRPEMYQWYPYLSPDCKLERAWLSPLRSFDRAALGLAEMSPARAAARERLRDAEPPEADLTSALCNEPSQSRRGAGRGHGRAKARPVLRAPEASTWRKLHADVVKKAFPTSARYKFRSPEELRQVLLAEKSTRLMLGAKEKSAAPLPSEIKAMVDEVPDELLLRLRSLKVSELTSAEQLELMQELQDASGHTSSVPLRASNVKEMVQLAVEFATDTRADVPLSDEEYRELVRGMSEEELLEAFQSVRPRGMQHILGSELSADLEAALQAELLEDQAVAGSAEDELRLALEILESLQQLGLEPSAADRRALLCAAHELGDPQLAAQVLDCVSEGVKPQKEPGLGPQGERLVQAMTRGGWEQESAEAFLKGQALLPRRDPASSLGKFQTRHLDPLQGLDPEGQGGREHLVQALLKPYEGPLEHHTAPPKAPVERVNSVSWTVKATKSAAAQEVTVTAVEVLEAMRQHPTEAQALLLHDSMGKVPVDPKELISLGLQLPTLKLKQQELRSFVLQVLRDAQPKHAR